MFKKLRNRFLLMHMGIVSLLVVLFFGSYLFLTYTSMENRSDSRMDAFMRMNGNAAPENFASVTINEMPPLPQQGPERQPGNEPPLDIQFRMTPGFFVSLDTDRKVLSVEDRFFDLGDEYYTHVTDDALAQIKTNPQNGRVRYENMEMKFRYIGDKIAFIDVTQESALFYSMFRQFLLIALPLLLIIFLISVFFANASIKPIETSYNRQKEFIADASHELKTPLATIGANLDVLTGTSTPEQNQWLGYIRSEVARMSSLTGSLLYLAKMDTVEQKAEGGAFNFSRLVEDHLLPFEAALFEKGITLDVQAEPDITVNGDEEQIKRLVGILADNAFRYADKTVSVKLCAVQNQATLSFSNDGPGIAPEEIGNIWERFYRSDKSRLYDGGYGLGLPMAKAIVERHKGKISCESEPGIRTEFIVKLPL
jgi:signal transduction histidine kinase